MGKLFCPQWTLAWRGWNERSSEPCTIMLPGPCQEWGRGLCYDFDLGEGISLVTSAALRPIVELLPVPALTVKRQFSVGATTLTLRANLEVDLRSTFNTA